TGAFHQVFQPIRPAGNHEVGGGQERQQGDLPEPGRTAGVVGSRFGHRNPPSGPLSKWIAPTSPHPRRNEAQPSAIQRKEAQPSARKRNPAQSKRCLPFRQVLNPNLMQTWQTAREIAEIEFITTVCRIIGYGFTSLEAWNLLL